MNITESSRFYFGPELIPRFNKLNTYSNVDTATFAIHSVPLNKFYWGTSADGFMAENFLHMGGRRVVLWVLADLNFINFVNDNGTLSTAPYVAVTPLLDEDFSTGVRVINKLASPPKSELMISVARLNV